MGYPVTHFEVLGADVEALQRFYAEAFDWTVQSGAGGYAMVNTASGEGISGGVGRAMPGGAGHVTFYVQVDDVAGMLKQIERLGGKTVLPETAVPDGPTIGLFADPEGHIVGLAKARNL